MSAWLDAAGMALRVRIEALLRGEALAPEGLDALACEIAAWQRDHNPVYARLWRAERGHLGDVTGVDDIPAVPTDVFKAAEVASFDLRARVREFLTSGTSQEVRGRHAFADTSLYAEGACRGAARWLLPQPKYRMVLVAESEADAPHSSLTFMLARFAERWALGAAPFVVRGSSLDLGALSQVLDTAQESGDPVALLGTSFGFVHLVDALGDRRWEVARHSVAMFTGGFKGRSREVDAGALGAMVRAQFGAALRVAAEYGMTELSSQAYDAESVGRYEAPRWMRVRAVDPVSLAPLGAGAVGLLRVVDLCNLGSVVAVQTSDLGRCFDDGSFEVLGRAPGATPRGCARALDALLAP